MSRPHGGPTVLQMALGQRLKALRVEAGLTAKAAAEAVSRSGASAITRMELAQAGLDPIKVKPLLSLYGAPDAEAEAFLGLLREANRPGWWRDYRDILSPQFALHVSLETSAEQIRSYQPSVVPGLFQTSRYTEALLRRGFPHAEPAEIARRVQFRMDRQETLHGRNDPPLLWMVLDETVFARPAATPEIMREQIDHLREQATRPNVSLQIIPFQAGLYHGAFGPFSIFRFPVAEFADIVTLETVEGTLHRNGSETVDCYRAAFENLFSVASPIGRTDSLFDTIIKEYYK
jgi:hypothetical protein